MNRRWTVWIWIAAVVALVALFNFYPTVANFPAVIVAIPTVAFLFYRFSSARRTGSLSFNNEVIGPITALHFIIVSITAGAFVVLWPIFMLSHVRNNSNELTAFVDIPVVSMIVIAAITAGVALYYARLPRR